MPIPVGLVVEQGRGSLPFALIHKESLVACAAWALGESGVRMLDSDTDWSYLQSLGTAVVLHDPLCPMTPVDFIVALAHEAVRDGVVVVGVRPVTDTVKQVRDGFVGATVDREALSSVCSPLVLPAPVVAALPGLPDADFAAAVAELASRYPVRLVEAPAAARRVSGPEDLALLEALTAR